MMSLPFGLFTQVSGSGPLGPLVILVHCFSGKIRLYISCESSARQDSHEISSLIFFGR